MKFFNKSRAKALAELSPEEGHVQMVHLLVGYEFPWDFLRSTEIALFRSFAASSISRLLDATGEFRQRGQKRYDDTAILVSEFLKNGYDSPRGKRAIARINAQHGRFTIANEDFLFVLSTFVLDPIDWINRFGWRPMTKREQQALFLFWREVGKRMHLEHIPETLRELRVFAADYTSRELVYDERSRRVADATIDVVRAWLPLGLRWLVQPAVNALIDEEMRRAFGYARPSAPLRFLLHLVLTLRAWFVFLLPKRQHPAFVCDKPTRTYSMKYEIEQLGPTLRSATDPTDSV